MRSPDADAAPQQGPLTETHLAPPSAVAAHEVLSFVMPHLTLKDRTAVSRVSKKWKEIEVAQHHLWRNVDAGSSHLDAWHDLCRWANTRHVTALKARINFPSEIYGTWGEDPKADLIKRFYIESLLGMSDSSSITSLYLTMDTSAVDGSQKDANIELVHRFTDFPKSIMNFPASLRQLKFITGANSYHVAANLGQLTALTALSFTIPVVVNKEEPLQAFPASLRRLEMYCTGALEELPSQLTNIRRLESLSIKFGHGNEDYGNADAGDDSLSGPVVTDLSLLNVQSGKPSWCNHLVYLSLSRVLINELPSKLPRSLVTLELREMCNSWEDPERYYASFSSLVPLKQLRSLVCEPFKGSDWPILKLKGLSALDLTGGWSPKVKTSLFSPLPPGFTALKNLEHLGLRLLDIARSKDILPALTRIQTLKLGVSPGIYSDNTEKSIDFGVYGALKAFPRLKAVYSNDWRMQYLWNWEHKPASKEERVHREKYDMKVANMYRTDIELTPQAYAVRASKVPLRPKEEWESVVGYGKQWTPWNQVE